jgi:hypothetical protein
MSGFAAWHHAPGEYCTHPERQWVREDGTVDKGPWPPEGPVPTGEGHWVCPGPTALGLGSGPGA